MSLPACNSVINHTEVAKLTADSSIASSTYGLTFLEHRGVDVMVYIDLGPVVQRTDDDRRKAENQHTQPTRGGTSLLSPHDGFHLSPRYSQSLVQEV